MGDNRENRDGEVEDRSSSFEEKLSINKFHQTILTEDQNHTSRVTKL